MNALPSTSFCNYHRSTSHFNTNASHSTISLVGLFPSHSHIAVPLNSARSPPSLLITKANPDDSQAVQDDEQESDDATTTTTTAKVSSAVPLDKDLKKVVQKTAASFAPRASTASKNPAVPGTTLYTVFEVQAYISMALGGVLSFNLLFPSNEPDIWRLMGMWSIWMFTIPSLRARDCSKNEKEALNYLFLLVPLLNVTIPFFLKSFAVVWSADTVAFFGMYAWKLGWLQRRD